MRDKMKNNLKLKDKTNNHILSQEETIWFIINVLRTHKIEVIESELIKEINSGLSFHKIKEILQSYSLNIKEGKSEEAINYILYKDKENNKIDFGVLIEKNEDNFVINITGQNNIEKQDILKYVHVQKLIVYQDKADKEVKEPFSMKWFFKEMLNYKGLWKSIVIWSILMQLLSFALPLMTQTIIDKVIVNQAQSTLISLVIGVFIFNLFSLGLNWARQNMILFIGNKIDNVLAIKVIGRLFKLPLNYFQKRSTGTIISRVHAVESIREFLAGSFITLVLDVPFVFIFLIIMMNYSILLSSITLFFVFLMIMVSIVVAPRLRAKSLEQAKISGKNQAFLTEYVSSMEPVKALQLETQLINEYKRNFGFYLEKTKETRELSINYNTLMTWLEQTLSLLVLGIGAYLSMKGQDFTIGMLIAFQMFSSRVTQPLLRISGVWQEFQQTQISMMRLKDIMDEEEENYQLLKKNSDVNDGRIEIKNLSFKYEDHLPYLYENLNICIPEKSMTVIQGPSGCGKSTMTKLLQGFYSDYKGLIEIDGIDIKQMGVVGLRNQFGVVPQETVLFSGSILDNFKVVNPYITLDEVVEICKSVGIHEAISKLPEAYETQLGERGSGLSGGQKQRIAIARALAKKPKILIFDESISNLDEESKKLVCDTIKKLNGVITIIFITHIDLGDVGMYQKIMMKKNN